MIILRHGKFFSGGKLFSSGCILPDTDEARRLVELGWADIVNNKPAKKRQTDKAEAPRENDEGNS